MAYRIFCYDNNSKSGVALKDALGAMFLKHKGTTFKPKSGDVVFNWGSTKDKPFSMLNSRVAIAVNKKRFFETMKTNGASHLLPAFWTAAKDIPTFEYPIVCRTTVSGHDGAGIVIANKPSDLVPAELYTKLIKATKEYRIHVGRDSKGYYSVILVQRKGKLNGSTKPDTNIKTTSNDYVFVHGEQAPPVVTDVALKVFAKTGMDFGGLDVIYDGKNAYVLEVNSAPELGKIAVDAYKTFFEGYAVGSENTDSEAKSNEGANADNSNGLLGSGAKSSSIDVGEIIKGLGQPTTENMDANVLSPEPVSGVHAATFATKGIGAVAVVSGGDTAGLIAQLEKAIQERISAAKSAVYAELAPKISEAEENAYQKGLAAAPKGFTQADLDAAEAKGAASVKSALKSLLAA